MRKLVLFFLLLGSTLGWAQTNENVLSLETYLEWVQRNHPLVKAVENKIPTAKAELVRARGAFDPTLAGNYASKEFKGDLYYRLPSWSLEQNLRGPISVGVDWNATAGLYTNPQDKLPEEGMFAIGGMVELGNGLFTDASRTTLRLAKAGVDMSEAEAQLYKNELLLKATKSYWKWYAAHENLKSYEKAIEAAQEVYDFALNAFEAGDASAMDTLDAHALLTTWQTDYFQARNKALAALYDASTWLWSSAEEPMVLNPEVTPSNDIPTYSIPLNWDENHPLIRYNDAKEKQLRAKRALAREYIKPKVAVGGALLVPGNLEALPSTSEFDENNRVLKAKIDMPIFVREGIGYARSQNLQLETFEFERAGAEYALKLEWASMVLRIAELDKAVQASLGNQNTLQALLDGEKEKFELGDSELIKVNLRTSYYAKAMIQRANLQAELGMAWATWANLAAAL
ncbi:MAG: hypothetical protein RL754_135 [Bacteroidota bacterium]|jgi:outer membrane protein TolC